MCDWSIRCICEFSCSFRKDARCRTNGIFNVQPLYWVVFVCVCTLCLVGPTNNLYVVIPYNKQALQGISSRTFKSPIHTNTQSQSAHIHTSNSSSNYYYKLPPLISVFFLCPRLSCILNATRGTVWPGSHMIEGGEWKKNDNDTLPQFPFHIESAVYVICVISNASWCTLWWCGCTIPYVHIIDILTNSKDTIYICYKA